MTDEEKIEKYREYMIERNYDDKIIEYNILVVKLLVNNVLYFFEENLESIDTYTFEEFTDKINIIDKYLGGRDGIPKMLNAMMDLTEFLKINKLIKGGKIAHYKRMFSDVEYCINKYDTMTGKKDDSREFIKDITTGNKICSDTVKVLDDYNVYGCYTLNIVDKIINDIPIDDKEDTNLIREVLIKFKLMEKRYDKFETTKKGRLFSRLSIDERYGALLYLFYNCLNWQETEEEYYGRKIGTDINNTLRTIVSIFYKTETITLNQKHIADAETIELSMNKFRMAKIESIRETKIIFDIVFINMGLVEAAKTKEGYFTYRVTSLGEKIFNILYYDVSRNIKNSIEMIGHKIKDREYANAEKEIIKHLSVYGGSTIVWDYLGQILLLEKKYKYAYKVLKYGYEKSSKRGKISKAVLYHLILCCRKLKNSEEYENYENKLIQ